MLLKQIYLSPNKCNRDECICDSCWTFQRFLFSTFNAALPNGVVVSTQYNHSPW